VEWVKVLPTALTYQDDPDPWRPAQLAQLTEQLEGLPIDLHQMLRPVQHNVKSAPERM
jgi:hypothetical protein